MRRLVIAARAGVALMIVALVASLGGARIPVWPCVLLEHFRVQYLALGAALVVAAAALRLRGWFDLAAIATLGNALVVAQDLCASSPAMPKGGVPLRVLVLNVLTESAGFAEVRQLITDERPDVIGLVEVDRRWLTELAPVLAGYPGRIEAPRADHFGIALYARGQVTGAVEPVGSTRPSVVAELAIDAARLRVLLTHPVPPMSRDRHDEQRIQIDAIADRVRATPPPMLVLGDLNTTPWSAAFARLLGRSGLCDSRAGFGVQASFPAGAPLVRVPIDHVLGSCTVGVRDRRIARAVGSDHLPVVVDLVVPRPR